MPRSASYIIYCLHFSGSRPIFLSYCRFSSTILESSHCQQLRFPHPQSLSDAKKDDDNLQDCLWENVQLQECLNGGLTTWHVQQFILEEIEGSKHGTDECEGKEDTLIPEEFHDCHGHSCHHYDSGCQTQYLLHTHKIIISESIDQISFQPAFLIVVYQLASYS